MFSMLRASELEHIYHIKGKYVNFEIIVLKIQYLLFMGSTLLSLGRELNCWADFLLM